MRNKSILLLLLGAAAIFVSAQMYGQECLYTPDFDTICADVQEKERSFKQACAQLKTDAAIKLIKKLHGDALELICGLHEHALEKFFVFKPETIESAVFLQRIEQNLLPALDFCQEDGVCDEDAQVLARIASATAKVYQRLLIFYQESVKAALEQADDSKKLQKLLELV